MLESASIAEESHAKVSLDGITTSLVVYYSINHICGFIDASYHFNCHLPNYGLDFFPFGIDLPESPVMYPIDLEISVA